MTLPGVVGVRLAALAIGLLASAGCGGGTGGTRTTPNGESMNYHGTQDVSDKTKIVLKLGDYYYEPTILIGRPGQHLAIQLDNVANHRHSLSIEHGGQIVDEYIEPSSQSVGQTTTVVFPKSGAIVFQDEFYEHRGMRGVLEVK